MDENEKLAKEAMKSLFTPAPADLKASLKRMARAKAAAPSLWDGLLESLSGGAWAYGATAKGSRRRPRTSTAGAGTCCPASSPTRPGGSCRTCCAWPG